MDALPEEKIVVEVDEIYAAEVDANDLVRAIEATLVAENRPDGEVSLLVTDDEAVAAYNQEYRGVEGPTDVLSFAAQEPTPGFVTAPEMASYLGDIVIALPYTRRQAADLNRPLIDELRLLTIHGTLHLLGYDHTEHEAEAVMWAKQDAILVGLTDNSTTVES
jgi:probable rRNA maturation factor